MPDMLAKSPGSTDDIFVAGSSYSLLREEERKFTKSMISTPVTANLGGRLLGEIMAWKSLPVNPLRVSIFEVQDWEQTSQIYSSLEKEIQKESTTWINIKHNVILELASLGKNISRPFLIVFKLITEILKYPLRTSTLLASQQGVDVIKEGSDLFGMDLSGSNLRRADSRRSNFRNANLEEADLSYANIRGAQLFGANLKYANLEGADLTEANLSFANLLGANLQNADLTRARLISTHLEKANLSGAKLRSANLSNANLKDTILPIGE